MGSCPLKDNIALEFEDIQFGLAGGRDGPKARGGHGSDRKNYRVRDVGGKKSSVTLFLGQT